MRIFLSPQISDKQVHYQFYQDQIKATVAETVVFFDFSKVEDDKLYQVDHELVTSVRRAEGTLEVILMNYLSETETDQALLFPDWMEPEETEFKAVEPIEALEVEVSQEPDEKDKEIALLKAKVTALEEAGAFRDDLIQEMAMMLYG